MGCCSLLMVGALYAGHGSPPDAAEAAVAARAEAAFAEGVRRRDDPALAAPSFRRAAAALEELRQNGAHNTALYRNLGNAYLLADDLPRAILAYRRGLRLAPGDGELLAGLQAARNRVEFAEGSTLGRPPPIDPLQAWRGPWLLVAALFLYCTACVCLTRWLMTRRAGPLASGLMALANAGLLLGLTVWVEAHRPVGRLAVITDDGVLLRRGDALTYPPRYDTPVNRGVEGRLLTERGNWIQLEVADGAVGWVPRGYALIDGEER